MAVKEGQEWISNGILEQKMYIFVLGKSIADKCCS